MVGDNGANRDEDSSYSLNEYVRNTTLQWKILQAFEVSKLRNVFFIFNECDRNREANRSLVVYSVLISGTLTAVESFLTISSGPEVASDNVCTASWEM